MTTRRRVVTVLLSLGALLVVAAIVVAIAFGQDIADHFRSDPSAPEPIAGAHLGGDAPGSLISAVTMPTYSRSGVGREMNSARVTYRSTNGDTGASTVVTGTVFTPMGTPPAGGWPVVAFGHGTIGIDEPCAPSKSDTLLGMSSVVVGLTRKGYAVGFADYQGLGSPGPHPYLDNKTAGYNIIDSVRALRATFPDVSSRWAAFGGSQGGGAVWSADEQAMAYAPDLTLVGAAVLSPAVDVAGIVDKAEQQTMTFAQRTAWENIVETLARIYPNMVDRDDYRRGAAAKYWNLITSCSGSEVHDRDAAADQLEAADLTPATPADGDVIRDVLMRWAASHQPLTAPLSVVYGGSDLIIDAQWTSDAILRSCAMGGVVQWDLQPDKGHGDVQAGAQFAWLADRFAGRPAPNACPAEPAR